MSSWREVGIPSTVERADSQPVLGGSNELEHRCKNCATTKRGGGRERVRETVSADRALPALT